MILKIILLCVVVLGIISYAKEHIKANKVCERCHGEGHLGGGICPDCEGTGKESKH